MKIKTSPHFALLGALLASAQLASAATIIASADSTGRSGAGGASVSPTTASTNRLAVGPVDGSADSFRSYLTFDLTSLSSVTEVSLTLFDAEANESNTSPGTSLSQTFTLFSLASDWDSAAAPGPNPGTVLATITKTVTANESRDLVFASTPALITAFNDAVGGNLYLGIYSPQGEAATDGSNTRAFQWLRATDPTSADYLAGEEPTLTYTAVPEPSAALLGGLGALLLLRRRR